MFLAEHCAGNHPATPVNMTPLLRHMLPVIAQFSLLFRYTDQTSSIIGNQCRFDLVWERVYV